MARSKEFDEERALAAAMNAFWRQGYENTSLEDLIREMGIARQSLYDTFGDKRALYLKAMAFYRERTNLSLRQSLASAPTVKAEVESIFADALRRGQRGPKHGAESDAGALAKFFVATIQGMRAMARLKSDRRALRQVARIALAVFDR